MRYNLKLYTFTSNNKLIITRYILIHLINTSNKNLKNNFLSNKSTTVNLMLLYL